MANSTKTFRKTRRNAENSWVPDSQQKYAAIDIGSNGVRLLLSKVMTMGEHCVFAKESLVRMPIRLGEDVFKDQAISPKKEEQLVSTLIAFSHLLKAYEPRDYRACATSAMRESSNGARIAARIRDESQLNLKIIDGGEEAEMIFASHIAETLHPDRGYLYIDVGGGSTELTFFARSESVISHSFPIGTVRLLNGQVRQRTWDDMHAWVLKYRPQDIRLSAIGSGGNMNKILRLSSSKNDAPVSYTELHEIDVMLNSYTIEERIRVMRLRPDRADVIIHASKIFKSIMEWGKISEIYVPQFGLADGLVHHMHDQYVNSL